MPFFPIKIPISMKNVVFNVEFKMTIWIEAFLFVIKKRAERMLKEKIRKNKLKMFFLYEAFLKLDFIKNPHK